MRLFNAPLKYNLVEFVGPYPHRDRDYCIASKFCNFHLKKIVFTLSEPIYLMKMFRLLRMK
jgi:hypothetical protein